LIPLSIIWPWVFFERFVLYLIPLLNNVCSSCAVSKKSRAPKKHEIASGKTAFRYRPIVATLLICSVHYPVRDNRYALSSWCVFQDAAGVPLSVCREWKAEAWPSFPVHFGATCCTLEWFRTTSTPTARILPTQRHCESTVLMLLGA
jgi:hypothetical protein